MAMKSRYMTGSPRRVTLVLDSDTLRDLDQIAPDNIGEAVRFCIQHALAAGAVFRATTQHTAAQCRKHQQRYPANAAPLPTTYGGHVMTVRPAPIQVITPEPIQTAESAYMDRKAAEWIEANEPRLVGALVTERAAQVTEPAAVWTQPEPIQPQRAHPSEARPGTLEEYLMYADDDDEPAQVVPQPVATQEPTVIRGQPLSAAALAAVAAIALTDEEIRALDPARGGARPFIG